MLKTSVSVLLLAAALSSCGGYTPPDPVETHKVELSSLGRDTTFVVENRSRKEQMVVNITGNSSGIGVLRFSPDSARSDSGASMAFGPGAVQIQTIMMGIKGNQFVHYFPVRDSTQGNVVIQFTFQ